MVTTDDAQGLVFACVSAQRASVGTTPGQRLRSARVARGFGVRELARLSGVSPPTITRYEKDERGVTDTAEVGTLVKIVTTLGVRLDWVRTGAGPMDSPPPAPTTADPYPERAAALARLEGLLPLEVVEIVRSAAPVGEKRPDEFAWVRFALRRLDEHNEGIGATSRRNTGTLERVEREPAKVKRRGAVG